MAVNRTLTANMPLYEHLRNTRYNRDLVALARRVRELGDVLDAFCQHTAESLEQELLAGGLTAADLDLPRIEGALEDVGGVTGDAAGFRWAVAMFQMVAEGAAFELRDIDDPVSEVRPDAVAGGKAGA